MWIEERFDSANILPSDSTYSFITDTWLEIKVSDVVKHLCYENRLSGYSRLFLSKYYQILDGMDIKSATKWMMQIENDIKIANWISDNYKSFLDNPENLSTQERELFRLGEEWKIAEEI